MGRPWRWRRSDDSGRYMPSHRWAKEWQHAKPQHLSRRALRPPGPLAQLGLGRDGTFYVVAAGRCNQAGQGSWQGVTTGNSSFIGIEAENTGLSDGFDERN